MRNSLSLFRPKDLRWGDDFDKMVEEFFGRQWNKDAKELTTGFSPATDVQETDTAYLIHVDLPGVTKENIKVDVNDGRLSITGERSLEKKEDKANFHRFERQYGRFERHFGLPTEVDVDNIDARFENGELEVTVPKLKTASKKTVEINGGRSGAKH